MNHSPGVPAFDWRFWTTVLAAPALAFTLLFFVAPLSVLLGYSFTTFDKGEVVYSVNFGNFLALLTNPFYLGIMARTVGIAVTTTALCIVLGYPIAYQIAHASPRWRPILLMGVVMPLLVGGVVRGYGWILILDRNGVINNLLLTSGVIQSPLKLLYNFTGVTITMIEVLIPFFILPLVGVLSNIDPGIERAALSMGARYTQTFFKVTLPLSLSGVVAGGSIVLSLALNIFVIPRIIGGPSYMLLSTLAYQQVGTVGNWPFGSAVAAIMLAITLAVIVITNRLLQRRYRYFEG